VCRVHKELFAPLKVINSTAGSLSLASLFQLAVIKLQVLGTFVKGLRALSSLFACAAAAMHVYCLYPRKTNITPRTRTPRQLHRTHTLSNTQPTHTALRRGSETKPDKISEMREEGKVCLATSSGRRKKDRNSVELLSISLEKFE
jgi:hypothetical protein